MKKIIIIALLLSSFGVMAQSKKKEYITTGSSGFYTFPTAATRSFPGAYLTLGHVEVSSTAWIRVNNLNSGLFLQMDRYPISLDKEIESITIHVNRSRTVWVNDSTLVIKQK